MQLLPGSPAINGGTRGAGLPTPDQGGLGRVGATDIGAVESQGFTFAPTAGSTPQSAYAGLAFANPLGARLTEKVSNAPLPGVPVTFTGPASGAGIKTTTQTATTRTTGVASVVPTANLVGRDYTGNATARGLATALS